MKKTKLTLSVLPEKFGICQFDEKTPLPSWAKTIDILGKTCEIRR